MSDLAAPEPALCGTNAGFSRRGPSTFGGELGFATGVMVRDADRHASRLVNLLSGAAGNEWGPGRIEYDDALGGRSPIRSQIEVTRPDIPCLYAEPALGLEVGPAFAREDVFRLR